VTTPQRLIVAVNALNVRPGVVDGAITYTLSLLRELREARPDWQLVAFVPPGENRMAEGVERVEVRAASGIVGRILWESTLLSRALRRRHADVLLAPYESLPVAAPCPTVVVAQNLFYHRPGLAEAFAGGSVLQRVATRARIAYYRRRMPAAYRNAQAVIAVSAETARVLQESAGLDPRRTHVIHEGSDSTLLPLVPEATLRDSRVLIIGSLMPYKGHELALEAFALARVERPELRLEIVGGAWRGYETSLRAQADRLNLGESVLFRGAVDPPELARLYATSLMLLHLSECESFGLPALEAMRFGLPVVAAARSSLPEVVGEAGILVEPNAAFVGTTIVELADSPARRAELAALGRERAAEKTWRATAEQVARVLESAGG
jgi:glycosyltransferase involved in cell wall biosynthesis